MKYSKSLTIIALLSALLIIAGCAGQTQPKPVDQEPLYNSSLNQDIEGLAQANETAFEEFLFNYTSRPEAKYELADDDVFALGKDFDSSEISVLGVMLGDNYSEVLSLMGAPDVMYVPKDKSYRNMEYGKKIGIGGVMTGVTFHLENDTVVTISLRRSFAKYLPNSTFGRDNSYLYAVFDTPDYQDFTNNHKVFHYVENGIDFYLRTGDIDIISIQVPKAFKGIKYVKALEEISPGVYVNVTKTVLIE